jgi:hypothetical protein
MLTKNSLVQSLSNVRFYPEKDTDKGADKQNCKPGTLVDQIVTSTHFNSLQRLLLPVAQGLARHSKTRPLLCARERH